MGVITGWGPAESSKKKQWVEYKGVYEITRSRYEAVRNPEKYVEHIRNSLTADLLRDSKKPMWTDYSMRYQVIEGERYIHFKAVIRWQKETK